MASQENPYMGQMGNVPIRNDLGMSPIAQPSSQMTESQVMGNSMTYRAVYPEVYYKLKPYISMACDLMDSYGIDVPTQQQVDDTVDGIYEDFCRMYPDMADYMNKGGNDPAGDPPPFRGGFLPRFGFRRRGLGRDFIEALLLAELFGRGGFLF